jgi:hypothetical protein
MRQTVVGMVVGIVMFGIIQYAPLFWPLSGGHASNTVIRPLAARGTDATR